MRASSRPNWASSRSVMSVILTAGVGVGRIIIDNQLLNVLACNVLG
jgi:hypothetical protein